MHAAGYLSPAELSAHIAACDLFVQPYPDGITSRRTSAMACLSRARPVVTTTGHLTEPLWAENRRGRRSLTSDDCDCLYVGGRRNSLLETIAASSHSDARGQQRVCRPLFRDAIGRRLEGCIAVALRQTREALVCVAAVAAGSPGQRGA